MSADYRRSQPNRTPQRGIAVAAALFGVPPAFVSGDQGLCDDVAAINPNIRTVAVSQGIGPSTVSIAP